MSTKQLNRLNRSYEKYSKLYDEIAAKRAARGGKMLEPKLSRDKYKEKSEQMRLDNTETNHASRNKNIPREMVRLQTYRYRESYYKGMYTLLKDFKKYMEQPDIAPMASKFDKMLKEIGLKELSYQELKEHFDDKIMREKEFGAWFHEYYKDLKRSPRYIERNGIQIQLIFNGDMFGSP